MARKLLELGDLCRREGVGSQRRPGSGSGALGCGHSPQLASQPHTDPGRRSPVGTKWVKGVAMTGQGRFGQSRPRCLCPDPRSLLPPPPPSRPVLRGNALALVPFPSPGWRRGGRYLRRGLGDTGWWLLWVGTGRHKWGSSLRTSQATLASRGPRALKALPMPPGAMHPGAPEPPVPSWCRLPRIQVDKAQPLPRSLPGSLPQSSTSKITAQI